MEISGVTPLAEDTGETRLMTSEEKRPSAPSLPAIVTRSSAHARHDALRAEEVGRINVYARLMIGMSVVGLPLVLLLRISPSAKALLVGAVIVVAVTYTWVWWVSRTPARFDDAVVAVVSQLQGLASHCASLAFGLFSPYPALVAVGIYVYSLGASFRYSFAAYLNLALGHALLSGLVIGGVIVDPGLIRADYLPLREQIVVQICVQIVFLIAVILGRMSRQRTLSAVRGLERAVRLVAQRDALLSEVRRDLDQAVRIGGPGRYTEQVIGSFQLGTIIGRGAMGEIYEAFHLETSEPAAVKLMHRSALAEPAQLARFIREVEVAASLSAPNVVRFLEVAGLDAPMPYLAMERLEGTDLSQLLRAKGSLPLAEVLDLVEQVAEGLAAAHAAGIVHRDLKPQNLFAAGAGASHPAGRPSRPTWKILDFGVSKLADDSSTLTHGHVVGTPAYMAPEQALGKEVDHRADIYSLAVIAYRCLTGHPPFSGAQIPQVLYDVVHTMPPPPSQLADLPPEIDTVMAVAMSKRPRDRFSSAPELARQLARAARHEVEPTIERRARAVLARTPWTL
jgi:eukaryotic-like serine/threonine-protein kinase